MTEQRRYAAADLGDLERGIHRTLNSVRVVLLAFNDSAITPGMFGAKDETDVLLFAIHQALDCAQEAAGEFGKL